VKSPFICLIIALMIAFGGCGGEPAEQTQGEPSREESTEAATAAETEPESEPESAQIEILSMNAYIDTINTVHVVGEVENVGRAPATFVETAATLYDKDKNVLDTSFSYTYLDVLLPGEKSPFEVVFMGDAPSGIDSYRVQVQWHNAPGERPRRDIEILSHTGSTDQIGAYHIKGEVKNTGDQPATFVQIIATFYDADNKVVATAFTYTTLDTLGPSGTSPFELILTETSLIEQTKSYRIIAQSD